MIKVSTCRNLDEFLRLSYILGIFTNGGAKPNIIPEEAALYFYARAPVVAELNQLKTKMMQCFKAAATATGCQVKIFEKIIE